MRFVPLPADETPDAMHELCRRLAEAWDSDQIDRLLITDAFILDLLCIHPFADGNGCIAQLLTLLLLYAAGYEVGRYISLERIIEQTKETYYDALWRSSARRATIRRVLDELREQGQVECLGTGRSAQWRRRKVRTRS